MFAAPRRRCLAGIALAAMLCSMAMSAPAQQAADDGLVLRLSESLGNGRLLLDLRPRYNYIEETSKRDAVDAWTARLMIGWQTAPWLDTRVTAQWIHADHIGARRFNDDPAKFASSTYPLLPDPSYHGINQLFADYAGLDGTRLRFGRQVVRVGNQRFVSDNDFRQIPQVFDGATLTSTAIAGAEVQAGEYRRVRNTQGRTSRLRLHLLQIAWNPLPDHVLAAYAIGHDQANTGSQTGFGSNAYRIAGVRSEGSVPAGATYRFHYHAEFAQQKAFRGGDTRIDANYWRLGAGWTAPWLSLRLDHETKGSNGGRYGFQTPLTDLYAFNGTALQYTSTPVQGLRDSWFTLGSTIGRLDLFAELHQFRADKVSGAASSRLGRELDIMLTYPLLTNLNARLQHARFRAGAGARTPNDVDKTWLTLAYSY